MRWFLVVLLAVAGGHMLISPADARQGAARRFIPRRTIVSLLEGWPLKRAPRSVIVHPSRTEVHVVATHYVGAAAFTGVATTTTTAAPTRDRMTWEDGETLYKDEDWTEFTLTCEAPGRKIWLEIPFGRPQLDWVEVVFVGGDAQVIDFAERTCAPGLYPMIEFGDERNVDHVRVVARSRTDEAKVTLRIQRD